MQSSVPDDSPFQSLCFFDSHPFRLMEHYLALLPTFARLCRYRLVLGLRDSDSLLFVTSLMYFIHSIIVVILLGHRALASDSKGKGQIDPFDYDWGVTSQSETLPSSSLSEEGNLSLHRDNDYNSMMLPVEHENIEQYSSQSKESGHDHLYQIPYLANQLWSSDDRFYLLDSDEDHKYDMCSEDASLQFCPPGMDMSWSKETTLDRSRTSDAVVSAHHDSQDRNLSQEWLQNIYEGAHHQEHPDLSANEEEEAATKYILSAYNIPMNPSMEEQQERTMRWKKSMRGKLTKAYTVYAALMHCSHEHAREHLEAVASEQLTSEMIESSDSISQRRAAYLIYSLATKDQKVKTSSNIKQGLGKLQAKVLNIFMTATGKGYSTAWRHCNSALTDEMSSLMRDSKTFDRGMQMLIYSYSPSLVDDDPFRRSEGTCQDVEGLSSAKASRRKSKNLHIPGHDEAMAEQYGVTDGRRYLGPFLTEVGRAFRELTGKKYSTTYRHLKRAVTPEIAKIIRTPGRFNEGVQILVDEYVNNPPPMGRKSIY